MFNIIICDDDEMVCTQLEATLREVEPALQEKLLILICYSAEECLVELSNGKPCDLIFLDIEFASLNGLALGQKIREELDNQLLQIVYISNSDSYALSLFKTRPMDFLVKPLLAEDVKNAIKTAMLLANKNIGFFEFKDSTKLCRVSIKDIIYFMSDGRQIHLIQPHSTQVFYGKLVEIVEQVKMYGFIAIHKSYLINKAHVINYQYDELTMSNSDVLPISKNNRKLVRQQLLFKNEEENIECSPMNKLLST